MAIEVRYVFRPLPGAALADVMESKQFRKTFFT
jgi:hypothetical protein